MTSQECAESGVSPPKFLVDSTAARLARWLRFLGYDAILDRTESDAKLLARARREGRVLLTRKRTLGAGAASTPGATASGAGGTAPDRSGAPSPGEPPGRPGGALLLTSDFVSDQLKQVASEFGLSHGAAARCTVCNSELVLVSRAEADGRVPELVYRSRSEFAFCRTCDKYYWKGTHWEHAERTASDALEPGPERSDSC